jgi:hypothetical protein
VSEIAAPPVNQRNVDNLRTEKENRTYTAEQHIGCIPSITLPSRDAAATSAAALPYNTGHRVGAHTGR